MPGPRFRFSTRGLMVATALVGFDAAVMVRASSLGLGTAFPLFIGATLLTLHLFFRTYLQAADRINAAPQEKQAEMLLSLGCLVLVLMALSVPIVFVLIVLGTPPR